MATISRYALISVDELKEALQGGFVSGGGGIDSTLASICNKASQVIENHLDRYVIARGTLVANVWTQTPIVGYFTPPPNTARLYLREWPVTSVTSVYEDPSRAYGSTTLLTANTDYVASMP